MFPFFIFKDIVIRTWGENQIYSIGSISIFMQILKLRDIIVNCSGKTNLASEYSARCELFSSFMHDVNLIVVVMFSQL